MVLNMFINNIYTKNLLTIVLYFKITNIDNLLIKFLQKLPNQFMHLYERRTGLINRACWISHPHVLQHNSVTVFTSLCGENLVSEVCLVFLPIR